MKRIAILNCLQANEVCASAACLKAWNERGKAFARYQGEEAELVAFLRCNGCENDPGRDAGMQEKIPRLVKIGADAVHLGVCTKKQGGIRCPVIQEIERLLQKRGIPCVDGTH